MIADSLIADYILSLYEFADAPQVKWTTLQNPCGDDGIRWGLARVGGYDLIVMRGTTTLCDITKDLFAIANPLQHSGLGPVHAGFFFGIDDVWRIAKPLIKNPLVIAGHSLGGAHACLLSGLVVLDNASKPPVRRVTFGEPRSGFARLATIVSKIDTTLYVNRGGHFPFQDPIPELPLNLPLEAYVDSYKRTYVDVTPQGEALLWGPFAPHHMQLYREALK